MSSILDHSSNRLGPIEAGFVSTARRVRERLEAGETVSYDEMSAIGAREADDLFRRLDIVETDDGWELARK